MSLLTYYRRPGLDDSHRRTLEQRLNAMSQGAVELQTEVCYYIESELLTEDQRFQMTWLLGETYDPDALTESSQFSREDTIVEVGPRMSFSTAWSTTAVSICHACGINGVSRIERSRRYGFTAPLTLEERAFFLSLVHDRMTECEYVDPLTSFDTGATPETVETIPLIEEGRRALEELNERMGLAFDEWDLNY